MLLRLLTSVLSRWEKYYIMGCHNASLLDSGFSDARLVLWNQLWWECVAWEPMGMRKIGAETPLERDDQSPWDPILRLPVLALWKA